MQSSLTSLWYNTADLLWIPTGNNYTWCYPFFVSHSCSWMCSPWDYTYLLLKGNPGAPGFDYRGLRRPSQWPGETALQSGQTSYRSALKHICWPYTQMSQGWSPDQKKNRASLFSCHNTSFKRDNYKEVISRDHQAKREQHKHIFLLAARYQSAMGHEFLPHLRPVQKQTAQT